MKRNILALATASAIALAALAPSAQAMENEYNMLTGAIYNAFITMGLPTDSIQELSLAEVAQIKNLLEETGMGSAGQIQVILDRH
ncbi:MAG: hypothetical protein WBN04_00945 [Paracoccaceae bacterium]